VRATGCQAALVGGGAASCSCGGQTNRLAVSCGVPGLRSRPACCTGSLSQPGTRSCVQASTRARCCCTITCWRCRSWPHSCCWPPTRPPRWPPIPRCAPTSGCGAHHGAGQAARRRAPGWLCKHLIVLQAGQRCAVAPPALLLRDNRAICTNPHPSCPTALQLGNPRFLGFLLFSCSQAFLLNLCIFRQAWHPALFAAAVGQPLVVGQPCLRPSRCNAGAARPRVPGARL
jgi:hypothetical protein